MNNNGSAQNASWAKNRQHSVIVEAFVNGGIFQISKLPTQIAHLVLIGSAVVPGGRRGGINIQWVPVAVKSCGFARKLQVFFHWSLIRIFQLLIINNPVSNWKLSTYNVYMIATGSFKPFEANFHVSDVVFGLLKKLDFSFHSQFSTVRKPILCYHFSSIHTPNPVEKYNFNLNKATEEKVTNMGAENVLSDIKNTVFKSETNYPFFKYSTLFWINSF